MQRKLKLRLRAAILGLACTSVGIASFVLVSDLTGDSGSDTVVADAEVGEISGSAYSRPLPPGLQPSIHVAKVPVVALVTVESAESEWDTSLAELIGSLGIIRTVITASVSEYIKGEGPDKLTILTVGGEIGEISMVLSDGPQLAVGDRAVVFLNSPGEMFGWTLSNSYTIADGVATSVIDQRSLPADELLVMLRAAVDDPAPTPLPYPDFLPPVTEVSNSAVIAQVAITATEDTDTGTLIRASVSEPVKGDLGKTIEFAMLRAYRGGEVPADARLGVGDEAVIFLRDDGSLFDWYLYDENGVASSWVDEVSMPVERLLDVLRDKVALN